MLLQQLRKFSVSFSIDRRRRRVRAGDRRPTDKRPVRMLSVLTEQVRASASLYQPPPADCVRGAVVIIGGNPVLSHTGSGVVAGRGGQLPPHPKFWAVGKLSENLLLLANFRPSMQNLG